MVNVKALPSILAISRDRNALHVLCVSSGIIFNTIETTVSADLVMAFQQSSKSQHVSNFKHLGAHVSSSPKNSSYFNFTSRVDGSSSSQGAPLHTHTLLPLAATAPQRCG